MVSTPSSLSLLLSLLALLLCLRLSLLAPLPLLWVCSSRVGLCSGGLSWVGLSSAFLLSLSLPLVLRFCPRPSPYPVGSAVSASAHGLSGVRSPASCSTSGLLGLSLSACSLDLLASACCSFCFLFCTSLSRPFGFCFCGSFSSSLVASAASVEVSSDPLVRVPPSFPGFALFSRLLAFRSLLSDSLFLFVSLLLVASWSFLCLLSLPGLLVFLQLCWALFILSTSLLALFARPLLPFPSSWAFLPCACSCRVLFSGSVGVPIHC